MEQVKEGRYGLPVAMSMVIGMVIGIGIFFKAKPILIASGGNPKIALMAWGVGGFITIMSGLAVAELGAAIPETGGMIAWIKKLYGDKIGFLVGWAQAFIYSPGLIAVMGYYFTDFLFSYLGRTPDINLHYTIAALIMTSAYLVNIYTRKGGGYVQTLTCTIKLIPLIAIIIFGLMSTNNPEPLVMKPEVIQATSGSLGRLIGLALVPIMFAFDGWILVGTIAGDLKDVKKTLPKAIVLGISIVIVCYFAVSYAILNVFPADIIITQNGLGDIARQLFGNAAAKWILLGITISAYGVLNGNVLVSTRVPYAMAVEGTFPKSEYFKVVDGKFDQPVRSSWLMYVISMLYLVAMWATNDPDTLSNIPVALFFFFYLLVFYGVILLRKKFPELERPYTAPLYPVVPILAMLGGVYILYSSLAGNGYIYMGIGILITLTGLFFYKKKRLFVKWCW